MTLRDYQIAAIEKARAHVRAGKRAPLIVMPTGAGKTRTASEIVRLHVEQGGRVLWLAHRTELVEQAVEALTSAGLAVGVIAATSRYRPNPHASVQAASTQTLLARGTDFVPTLIVLDECVSGDTIVGGKPARDVRVGDCVEAWDGQAVVSRRVSHVFVNPAATLRTLHVGKRSLTVTDTHPIWVEGRGYVNASEVAAGDVCRVWRADEEIHERQREKDVLGDVPESLATSASDCMHDLLEAHVVECGPGLAQDVLESVPQHRSCCGYEEDERGARLDADDAPESDALRSHAREGGEDASSDRTSPESSGGQWSAANFASADAARSLGRSVGSGVRLADQSEPNLWVSNALQERPGASGASLGDRSGWGITPIGPGKGLRREENGVSSLARVDRVEVHERGSDGTFGGRLADGLVYNFEVEGEHNFFANGILTHNCHHYPADEWSQVVSKYPDALRIGLTATPARQDGVGLEGLFDSIVVATTIRQLTAAGHLTPLDVVAPDRVLSSKEIAQRPVDAYLQYARGEQAVVFAPHVKAAIDFAAEFRAAGVPTGVVTGDLAIGDRVRVLDDYAAGRIRVLCNVAVLTEGWDHPPTGVCILARGCGSPGLFIQIVGRVLRPHPGKLRALLIDLRGMVHVHGRPDEDRVYSLDGRGIRRAVEMGPERFCPVCQELMDPGATVCANCGKERAPLAAPTVVNAPLKRYARDALVGDSAEKKIERLARWLAEAAAKQRKPGWAFHRFYAGYERWPTWQEKRAAEQLAKRAA